MAFNSVGDLFVSDTLPGAIYEYTPGGVQSIFASGLNVPFGLAFDSAGDLFEGEQGSGNVNEFINNKGTLSTTPTVFASGFGFPLGLAFQGIALPVPEPSPLAVLVAGAAAFLIRRGQKRI
jgi:hypothetical protein